MKRQGMAMAVGVRPRNESGAGNVADQTRTGFTRNARAQPASSEPSLVPAGVSARTHTLILTGALDRSSAHALEAAIERLWEEGVTGITLDLRGLTHIDSIGVAVIAFRCGLGRRRGYEFALIPGSPFIHRAFERVGVSDLLPFQSDDVEPRLPALVISHRTRDGCEQ